MKTAAKFTSLGTLLIAVLIAVACPSLAWGVCDATNIAFAPAPHAVALERATDATLAAMAALIWVAAFLPVLLVRCMHRDRQAEGELG